MLFKSLATVGLLTTSVLADGAAIVSVIGTISVDNAALNNSLLSWNGGLIEALPILLASDTLESAITNGTAVANASAELTTDEAVSVYEAVNALAVNVNVTLDNFIDYYPKFANDSITFIVLNSLQTTKTDTDDFGAAVIAKVPSEYASIADGVIAGIDAAFTQAIDVYSAGSISL